MTIAALDRITRSFGPTLANHDVSLSVLPGEVIGLVGANGAGKSTLMRILCGVTEPDSGTLTLDGAPVDFRDYSPTVARRRGIRIVYQELSLCTNLTVAENFFLEEPGSTRSPLWRAHYRRLARAGIDAVFPGSGIDADARLADLPLGQRQMVEIARAANDPDLKLLILDEPTSSLEAARAAQLHDFVRRRAGQGISFIFISHKLREVLEIASRVVVMRNGRIAREGGAGSFTVHALVDLMGGDAARGAGSAAASAPGSPGPAPAREILRLGGAVTAPLGREIVLRAGDIVGFAGLEGSGQRDRLHAIRHANPDAGFVSGDRQREGVFPQWTVLSNISIGALSRRPLASLVSAEVEAETGRHWAERLRLDPGRLPSNVLHLSGGNQQKALVARALARQSDLLLLDDPTRGVDVASKHDFYHVVRQTAESGALVVWYSTEDIELLECTRVLVFHGGAIVRELVGDEISEESIVDTAFLAETAADPRPAAAVLPARASRPSGLLTHAIPLIGLGLVCAALTALNPSAASLFGIDLLLSSAVPLVLIALAQMFVVGGSQIDLGIGAFAGLVNVVSATVLTEQPALGVALLAAGLGGYAVIGALIEQRRIPAIVVTLGASFIWLGCGYTLQSAPGGMAPDWLMAAVGWQVPGLPTSLLLILAVGLCGLAVDRSRSGVVLRGFGNNAAALAQGGWSALRYTVLRYVVAGAFAMAAGLSLTAITTASDINAGSGFTLLSIAAVVIGGCRLLGGTITPAGVVAGAVTLSLIGSLLSFLGVSTDYNAAVQGLLLIAILGLRTLIERRESAE